MLRNREIIAPTDDSVMNLPTTSRPVSFADLEKRKSRFSALRQKPTRRKQPILVDKSGHAAGVPTGAGLLATVRLNKSTSHSESKWQRLDDSSYGAGGGNRTRVISLGS